MPYTHTTWATLQSQLSLRLQDAATVFWTTAEIKLWLTEALRAFGLCSGFWRARGSIPVTSAVAFYDLSTLFTPAGLIDFTVTDQNIIQQLQYALLESASSQSSWTGTEMFSYQDLADAVQNQTNQFLSDTGIVVHRALTSIAPPPISRETLASSVIDVRRAAWLGATPLNYYSVMWREDEFAMTTYDTQWSLTSGRPVAFSVMAPPPLQIQIAPPPLTAGQLDLVTVDGVTLDPANGATVLGIPDDLTPAIKWGALADLLGKDGPASDPARAQFCGQRYQQYVQLARLLPVIIHTEVNGVPLIPCTLNDLDAGQPDWQNQTGIPVDVAIAGTNLIALHPVPDRAAISVTFDAVHKAPIPAVGSDYVQVGKEQLAMILDYAEHLALFKVGGAEFLATERQAKNFLLQSVLYNRRLSASARYIIQPKEASQKEKCARPREMEASGLGALASGPEASRG